MLQKVLIAGCGDLGLALARCLSESGYQVSGLRRHWVDTAVDCRFERVTADLTSRSSLRNIPRHFDQVVYCPTPAERSEAAYRQIYLGGLSNLLEALASPPLERFIFVSSTAVYGQQDGSWVNESSATEPAGFNGEVLLEAEQLVARDFRHSVSVRLAGLYGGNRQALLARIAAGARCSQGHWTNRIHRDDAAAMIAHIVGLAESAQCYIGVDHRPSQQCELFSWLADQLDAPAPRIEHNAALGNKRCSNERILSSGFSFQYPDFKRGYADLVRSARAR